MDQIYPAVILEGKSPAVEASRGAGDEREPSSLSEDQRPAAWLSPDPATLPLTQAELPGPWQSESLLAESWSTMGDVDHEETKSLDSSDGAHSHTPGEERSDNHSSMSDMVHLEKEEAELLLLEAEKAAAEAEEEEEEEEDEELQSSVLSVLGGESELAELQEEELDLRGPEIGAFLASVEEPHRHRQVVPPMALPIPLPIVRLEPPSTTSTPVPALTAAELEQLLSTQVLHPPPVLAATGVPAGNQQPLDQSPHPVEEPAVAASQGAAAPAKAEPEKAGPEKAGPEQSGPRGTGELPMMLCGGAALVAVVGVVAYGAMVYCRK